MVQQKSDGMVVGVVVVTVDQHGVQEDSDGEGNEGGDVKKTTATKK